MKSGTDAPDCGRIPQRADPGGALPLSRRISATKNSIERHAEPAPAGIPSIIISASSTTAVAMSHSPA
ncbi:MAG: hypothetical protein ACTHL1_01930, partial [Burkholderiaceae bacterium]